jgi:hypothetical protein
MNAKNKTFSFSAFAENLGVPPVTVLATNGRLLGEWQRSGGVLPSDGEEVPASAVACRVAQLLVGAVDPPRVGRLATKLDRLKQLDTAATMEAKVATPNFSNG